MEEAGEKKEGDEIRANSFSTRSLFCSIDILIAALYPKSQQKEAFAVTPKRIL
jgi:hypothetical protein